MRVTNCNCLCTVNKSGLLDLPSLAYPLRPSLIMNPKLTLTSYCVCHNTEGAHPFQHTTRCVRSGKYHDLCLTSAACLKGAWLWYQHRIYLHNPTNVLTHTGLEVQ
jgi:hypothetical protein